ncbi:MAG: hypothetical protein HXY18_08620 [Bryobacteraceae bacterium]|jgi:hypothetical protein|nr:hypothetical protein [Bryobacteraceae bacterium]
MRRLIFWEVSRGSWQYDIVVGLILAFIFLTPREIFKDQPRPLSIVQMAPGSGLHAFWIEPALLDPIPEAQRARQAAQLLTKRYGKAMKVLRVEPVFDSSETQQGYMAIVEP